MIFVLVGFFLYFVSADEFDPTQHENWKLLPHSICGDVMNSRIIGGEEAPMNAYPWIARIGYQIPKVKGLSFRCGGVITSSKTVLTAAHCVQDESGILKVRVIRLGEHDAETDPDCDDDFCADPVIDIVPSEILVPKKFSFETFKHDIALIRFKNEIKFTTFVKPICIGSGDFLKKNFIGRITEVAGWGIYDISARQFSDKLQVVKMPVVENSDCSEYYSDFADIGPTQICVGGKRGKDSCSGDSGGPLMIVDDGPIGPRYFLLGIVSFGAERCGKSATPGVYTSMKSYLEWFLNNLEKTTQDSTQIL